jgi:hypothetical protein
MKKALAVTTLGASVAAEKAVKAGAGAVAARRDASEPGPEPEAAAEPAAAAGEGTESPLFVGMSHEDGRNAKVTLYRDRIERVKERSRMSMSNAQQDAEMTAIKSVSSVQAKKDGIRFTEVTVYASGNNIDFKFGHAEAKAFRDAITALILGSEGSRPVANPEPVAPDVADQIRKLADLRDAGVLTDEEFSSKKTDLLGRM